MTQQFYSEVSILEISKCVHRDMYMDIHIALFEKQGAEVGGLPKPFLTEEQKKAYSHK